MLIQLRRKRNLWLLHRQHQLRLPLLLLRPLLRLLPRPLLLRRELGRLLLWRTLPSPLLMCSDRWWPRN